ncbi:MAG: MBL fold metallo-hydrolase [Clostridia bacterium]|nr:MBL fold metallo-hydrolase [Clostridia bacterium]
MIFRTLVSGSSGNAVLFSDDNTNILIDCGISAKRLIPLLCQAGISAQNLDYILVTHEHTDHCMGVGVLSRKFNLPVIASVGTWQGMNVGRINPENIVTFNNYDSFEVGTATVTPFKIPHDANMPTGYVIESQGKKYAVATDMGHVTMNIAETLKECNSVILEANYDEQMLINGSYPQSLKNRIAGKFGHLCNADCARFASYLFENGTEKIILGHLSDENNTPETAFKTVSEKITSDGVVLEDLSLSVAPRYEISINIG